MAAQKTFTFQVLWRVCGVSCRVRQFTRLEYRLSELAPRFATTNLQSPWRREDPGPSVGLVPALSRISVLPVYCFGATLHRQGSLSVKPSCHP